MRRREWTAEYEGGTLSNPQTVLIVDDSDGIRDSLRNLLSLEGYVTLEAADGVEAVDTLLLNPDRLIILLDPRMLWMAGQDILVLIDTPEEFARPVYIVVTADKSAPDTDQWPSSRATTSTSQLD